MLPETLECLVVLIKSAQTRYGRFASAHEALGVALEEWDELREAIRANDLGAIADEALDLAAVLIRLHEACSSDEGLRKRSGSTKPQATT